jgi:hypothetical protein
LHQRFGDTLTPRTIRYRQGDTVVDREQTAEPRHESILAARYLGTTRQELRVNTSASSKHGQQSQPLATSNIDRGRVQEQPIVIRICLLGDSLTSTNHVVEQRTRLDHDHKSGR